MVKRPSDGVINILVGIIPIHQINKSVLNPANGPLSVYRTRICGAQSLISDKTNDQSTSYFYV